MYFLKRIAYSLLVLWGVVTLVFFLFNVLPADPARLIMGQRSDEASIRNTRKELRLDQPLFYRYIFYLNDLAPITIHNKNDREKLRFKEIVSISKEQSLVIKKPYLGRSYRTKKLVSSVLADAFPGTALLAVSSMLFASIIGITLGILAAVKKDTIWDTGSISASVIGISMPSFFAGLLIAFLFGYILHAYTGLNMTGSFWEYDPIHGKRVNFKNLLLPTLALGIRPLAIITQLTRSSVLDVLSQDYIRTAYAKGLSRIYIILKHILPNALNPIITSVSGWFAELLAGSFFVEFIFGWKGVGKITVDALDKFDFPLVMGAVLLSSLIFIITQLITDIIYVWTDPRIKGGN